MPLSVWILTNSQFFQPAPTVKVSISVIFTAQPYRKEAIFATTA